MRGQLRRVAFRQFGWRCVVCSNDALLLRRDRFCGLASKTTNCIDDERKAGEKVDCCKEHQAHEERHSNLDLKLVSAALRPFQPSSKITPLCGSDTFFQCQ